MEIIPRSTSPKYSYKNAENPEFQECEPHTPNLQPTSPPCATNHKSNFEQKQINYIC